MWILIFRMSLIYLSFVTDTNQGKAEKIKAIVKDSPQKKFRGNKSLKNCIKTLKSTNFQLTKEARGMQHTSW